MVECDVRPSCRCMETVGLYSSLAAETPTTRRELRNSFDDLTAISLMQSRMRFSHREVGLLGHQGGSNERGVERWYHRSRCKLGKNRAYWVVTELGEDALVAEGYRTTVEDAEQAAQRDCPKSRTTISGTARYWNRLKLQEKLQSNPQGPGETEVRRFVYAHAISEFDGCECWWSIRSSRSPPSTSSSAGIVIWSAKRTTWLAHATRLRSLHRLTVWSSRVKDGSTTTSGEKSSARLSPDHLDPPPTP